MIHQLSIARKFSEFPAGRNKGDGPYSGELFRENYLIPLLKDPNIIIEVDLDGTLGYGSSFLEEAFGGLVRKHRMAFDDLKGRLKIHDTRQIYEPLVWKYIKEATSNASW